MSSATRAHGIAQTPERTKFFKCFDAAGLDYITDASMNSFLDAVVVAGGSVNGDMNAIARTNTAVAAYPAATSGAAGTPVVRDMGRKVSIYGSGGNLQQVYRHCQWQEGSASEGVAGSSPTWITHWVLTWSADGADSVQVVRLG